MSAKGCAAIVGLILIVGMLLAAFVVISGIDEAGAATPYKQYLPEIIVTYPTPPPR